MEKSVLEQIQDPPVSNKYNLTSTSQQYPPPQHGGRIPNIMDSGAGFRPRNGGMPFSDAPSMYGDTNKTDLVGRIHVNTPLNSVFFSEANLDKLQAGIQEQVFLMSGSKHRIDRQSDTDLKLIMRSYYLSFAKNNPETIAEDLEDLNRRVIGFASAKIYSELDFHLFYLKDLQEFAPPIANPTNVKFYGSTVNELKSFF
jgi:hypothetical protein